MAQALMTTEQNNLVQDGTEVPTILIAIAWNIWLARNRRVFDNVTTPYSTIKDNVRTKKEPRSLSIKAWTQIWEQPAAAARGPSI